MIVVYLLQCGRKTYIGATVNLKMRLRRHRREIKGGARYTSSWPSVKLIGYVSGFGPTGWKKALSYEWYAKKRFVPRDKHVPPHVTCISRASHFAGVRFLTKFSADGLVIHWNDIGNNLESSYVARTDIQTMISPSSSSPSSSAGRRRTRSKSRKRTNKKRRKC